MDSEYQTPQRVGLLVASVHTGSSLSLWQEVAKEAQKSDSSLFVFAGGRLESPEGQEYLRNCIYDLANGENIDALISWSSALGGYVEASEVLSLLEGLGPMPTVSIGIKKPGSPSVSFDAYAGIQSVVLHAIGCHNAKRIAFIRGPENHYSAQDRWRAYTDSLTQGGIAQDPRLVSDPMAWTEGAKAVDQLVVERGLIPGVDFDTLICSSDMMMFAASKRLQALGYTIGEQLKIAGYNDSRESRLLSLAATTARMPVRELAQLSFSLLMALLANKGSKALDIVLPSQLVVRRSCGCRYSLGTIEQARKAIGQMSRYIDWVTRSLLLTEDETEYVRTLFTRQGIGERQYLPFIEEVVHRYLDGDGDPNLLSEALFFYCEFFASPAFRQGGALTVAELFVRQRDLVAHEHAYEVSTQARRLDDLKGDLLSLRSVDAIPSLLKRHLADLGIEQGYLVLYSGDGSSFVGGFANGNLIDGQCSFAKELLLPPALNRSLIKAVYVVEPLYMENQPLGYLVLATVRYSGSLMEEIRSAVSSAVKGALLLDAANRAAEEAERANAARSVFFANIGEGLKEPLKEAMTLLAKNAGPGCEEVQQQIAHASHLVQLSLSYSGELEYEAVTCDLSTRLNMPGLPIVVADPERVDQIFEITTAYITEQSGGCTITADVSARGLCIIFASERTQWRSALGSQDPGLLLVQQISIQSGGTMAFDANTISVTLPWPTLQTGGSVGALKPMVYLASSSERDVPLSLKRYGIVDLVFPMEMKEGQLAALGRYVLAWDGGRDAPDLTLLVHQMSRHPVLSQAPMLCIGVEEGHRSLFAALTAAKSAALSDQTLLLVGDVDDAIAAELGMAHHTQRVKADEAVAFCKQRPVHLIISSITDPAFCRALRAVSRSVIVLLADRWQRQEVEQLGTIAFLIIAHTHMAENRLFLVRLARLLSKEATLPPLTAILAKRTVAYFDEHAHKPISRWQVAEAAHVSEDYLSRVFHKEMGLSPWEYLSCHRIALASELLLQGSLSINEVASRTGFSDQAYFCRVFRKIKGFAPSKLTGGP